MVKLLIFGTGSSAEKVIQNIREDKAIVVGYLDNNKKKQGTRFKNCTIYEPEKCMELDFDYIIIASVKYELIFPQLQKIGVNPDSIVSYFQFDHTKYSTYRKFLYADGMNYDEMQLQFESMKKYVCNMEYEVAGKIKDGKLQIPRIKSIDATMDAIIERHLSISRFGDGEFDLIEGRKIGFQEVDETLSKRLAEVLEIPVENHVVGLADVYGDLSQLEIKYADFFRDRLIKGRQNQYSHLDMNRTYYNAFISRIYSEMKDKSQACRWFKKVKNVWNERELVIVEGEATRFGVGNDLLDNAKSIQRILAPKEGAFQRYNEILNCCKKMKKDKLFLLALGPTATVLAYDLAKAGYQAVDIGHLDIEYEWYLRGIQEHKVVIEGKYTNEVAGGNVVAEMHDEKYLSEIMERCC